MIKKPTAVVKKKSATREWVESILIALALALFIRTFFFEPFKIPSGSMRMTLIEGDRLFVSKWRYGPKIPGTKIRLPGTSKPKRGDVIVFKNPIDHKRDFIKRLIALGGETVEIKDGDIYINGQKVTDPAIDNIFYYPKGEYAVHGPIQVPEGSYFVCGDNSKDSNDSRYWGFVDALDVVGRAEFIFWPLNRMRYIR